MDNKPFIFRVFHSLPGVWEIGRTVHSFGGKLIGTYRGTGTYRPVGENFLHYLEEGTLETEVSGFRSFREYYFSRDGDWKIFFDIGRTRLFLELVFEEGDEYPIEARGTHRCDPDLYEAGYRFIDPTTHIVTYTVTGPRKNYRIKSIHRLNSFL